MEMREIVKDSVRYPFSDWKKLLILGIIIVCSGISGIAVLLGIKNVVFVYLLVIIGVIIGFLANGYLFRIIKSSLVGVAELPKFNDWSDLFVDGFKLNIIVIIYEIPVILIMLVFSGLAFISILGGVGTNQFSVASVISDAGIECLKTVGTGAWATIAIVYMTVIYPVLLMAITNMANNDSKFSAAFKFREISNKITNIGWGNLIEWYITIGIIYYIITAAISLFILSIFNFHTSILGTILTSLIVTPYLSMYFYRAVALFYMGK